MLEGEHRKESIMVRPVESEEICPELHMEFSIAREEDKYSNNTETGDDDDDEEASNEDGGAHDDKNYDEDKERGELHKLEDSDVVERNDSHPESGVGVVQDLRLSRDIVSSKPTTGDPSLGGSLLGEPKTAPVLCTHDDIVISSTNTLSLPPICSFGVNTRKSAAQNKYYGEIQVSVGYAHVSLEPVTSESLDLVMEALSSVTLPSDEDFCEANEPLSIWDSVRFKYHGSASIGFDKLIVESLYIATNRHDVPAASSVPATPNVEGGDKGKSSTSKRRHSTSTRTVSRPMKDAVRLRLISERVQICLDHSILELCARDTDLNCDYEAPLSSAYAPTAYPESAVMTGSKRNSRISGSILSSAKFGIYDKEIAYVIATHRLAYLPGMLLAFHHKRATISKPAQASGGFGDSGTPPSSAFSSPSLSAIYNRPGEGRSSRRGSDAFMSKNQEELRFYGHHDVHLLPTGPLYTTSNKKDGQNYATEEQEETPTFTHRTV